MMRPYQSKLVRTLLSKLDSNPIAVLPTGGGKTFTAASLVMRHARPTLWVAHRQELVLQAERSLRNLGLNTGIVMAGHDRPPKRGSTPVFVGSVQTLANRELPASVELTITDECHTGISPMYADLYRRYPSRRVGLTATPFRLDGRGLGESFGSIEVGATLRWLIDQGYLVPFDVYAGPAPDMEGVKCVGGEYVKSKSHARSKDLVGDLVSHYQELAAGRPTICYAINVEHSKQITKAFNDAGIPWAHLDGKTPDADRQLISAQLQAGYIMGVSNCAVWTEGVDIPCVSCIIDAAPTKSLCRHIQKVGRGLRIYNGKHNCIILDHAGNHHRFGYVTNHIDYTLDAVKPVAGDPLGLKKCPSCQLLAAPGTPTCAGCGYDFIANAADRASLPGVVHDEKLTRYDELFAYQEEYWRMLLALHDGHIGKAQEAWRLRFGRPPVLFHSTLVDPCKATAHQKAYAYGELLRQSEKNNYNKGWASHQYRGIFGVWPSGFVGDMQQALGFEQSEY